MSELELTKGMQYVHSSRTPAIQWIAVRRSQALWPEFAIHAFEMFTWSDSKIIYRALAKKKSTFA